MKLHTIIILLGLFNVQLANAQIVETSGSVHFKSSFGTVDTAVFQNFSIGGEWMIGKNFGLNYNFDFVHRNDKIYQLHSSAGLIVGPPLIGLGIIGAIASGNTNNDTGTSLGGLGIIGGILLLILPEGVTYHIPIKYNWDLAPYANILGVDYMKNNRINKSYLRYAATFGAKFSYWNPKEYTIFGFTETRKTAGMGWTLGAGIGVGKTFK
jgi:hypothetical protein